MTSTLQHVPGALSAHAVCVAARGFADTACGLSQCSAWPVHYSMPPRQWGEWLHHRSASLRRCPMWPGRYRKRRNVLQQVAFALQQIACPVPRMTAALLHVALAVPPLSRAMQHEGPSKSAREMIVAARDLGVTANGFLCPVRSTGAFPQVGSSVRQVGFANCRLRRRRPRMDQRVLISK